MRSLRIRLSAIKVLAHESLRERPDLLCVGFVDCPWHDPIGQSWIGIDLREVAILKETPALAFEVRMNERPDDGRRAYGQALAWELDYVRLPAAKRREIRFGQMMMEVEIGRAHV